MIALEIFAQVAWTVLVFFFRFFVWLRLRERKAKKMQREAVARGHAEFVADKEGNVEFKWKEIK